MADNHPEPLHDEQPAEPSLPEPYYGLARRDGGQDKAGPWFDAAQMRAHALYYHVEQMRLMGLANGAVSLWAYNRRGDALHEARQERDIEQAMRIKARKEADELRADRDSWRDQADARTADAVQFGEERDALRARLDAMQRAGAPMANTMFNLAQSDDFSAKWRESFNSMQVAWDAAVRASPIPAGGEAEERAAFEAAMAKAGYELNPRRYRDGPYRASYYESGWLMWQAARSQLAGKERN